MIYQLLQMFLGLGLLVYGAKRLVGGASTLALKAGLSPLIVGLTVVAFGTSAPEMAVSVKTAWLGQSDLAVGNIVGSNIFNVLFILGISAMISPLLVSKQLIRLDVPLMVVASLLFVVFSLDGKIVFWEAGVLTAGILAYTWFLMRLAKKEKQSLESTELAEAAKGGLGIASISVVLGLVLLVVGSRFLVDSAVAIATALGVSQVVIGLTIVAAGTSLPEVATSIMATIKGERDIAVGNVVGSNIFNILAVGGISGLVSGNGLTVSPEVVGFDVPVMVATAVACLPIFFTGHKIARWEGFVFFAYYIFYISFLVMTASKHAALETFANAMTWFIIPLTTLTILVVFVQSYKKQVPRKAKG
jgi:cation:H+ antiporter